jgi:hypothetical protein
MKNESWRGKAEAGRDKEAETNEALAVDEQGRSKTGLDWTGRL